MSTEKLRECPFCGGKAEEPINMEWSDNVYDDWIIDCSDCRARVFDVTKEKAIEAWNTRHNNKQIKELYEHVVLNGYTSGLTGVFTRCKVCGASDYPEGYHGVINHLDDCLIGEASRWLDKYSAKESE